MISQHVEHTKEITGAENAVEIIQTDETCELDSTNNCTHKSVHVQTIAVEYLGRNKGTQTCKKIAQPKSTMVTKGTQTLITSESLSKLLSKPKIISTSSQTSPVDHAVPDVQEIDKNSQNVEHLPPSSINCAEKPELVASELDDEGNFGGDKLWGRELWG